MATESVLDIGSRRELFVDNVVIDTMEGQAGLKMHPPQRREIIFTVREPLENACSGVYSVLVKDNDQMLLYYRGNYPIKNGHGDRAKTQTANLAVSRDGIHFERPELGILDMGDGGKNNVIWQGIQAHNLVPFLDPNPDVDEDKRFKAVGGTGHRNLYALFSPDGIHWRLAQEQPLDIDGAFDSANVPIWDPLKGTYRLFSRYFHKQNGKGYRAIQSCESDDFIHWTEPVPHQYADDVPREEFYTNATMPCPGAEHILLSFPMRYVIERQPPVDITGMDYPGNPGNAGMSDAVMMSSRDGVHWNRPFLEAWLRAGLDEKNWTHRNQTPALGILTSDTEWSMAATEHYGWPDNRLRRLTVRPWGFASVNGGYRGGEIITKPLRFKGNQLRLNMSTSATGSVAVEIQDQQGRPVHGFALDDMEPIYGDALDQTVTWSGKADLSDLEGKPVRLKFRLHDADVFAFRFQP